MKFLFRSTDGLCLPQALRVQSEGHKVKFSVEGKDFRQAGDGLVEKVMNFPAAVEWSDVVVYDVQEGALPAEADKVRRYKPTVGTSELGGKLEHDREFGIDIARQAGIRVPEVESFSGQRAFLKALDYIRTKPRETNWVWKCNGKPADGAGTYVAKSEGRPEMERMLKHYEQLYTSQGVKPDFILTNKIDGCEISTEAWFNGVSFVLPNHTIERTKFFPGDLGEKTGCCGNVVWSTSSESPLVQKLILPLAPVLAGKFVGPLDVNVIIEEKSNEPVFLEFSPRFGYDAIFALMELFDSSFGEFLYQVAVGSPLSAKLFDGFSGDVRIHIPPYPAKSSKEGSEECVGVPIFGLGKATAYNPHHHLTEIMLDENADPVTSGPHGFVMSCSARGNTPKAAEEAAYKEVEKLQIPNMRYRNDLASVVQKIYDDVEATGWLGGKQAPTLGIQTWQKKTSRIPRF